MNNNININCNNCGKLGHVSHQCKLPITSYGMVVFRKSENGYEYLMIRRKDTFGYIDFVRGKYSLLNLQHIKNSINEMTLFEKERILNSTFDELWKDMWGECIMTQFKGEELLASKKFYQMSTGIKMDNNEIGILNDFVENSTTKWLETEWEFPKGRKNYNEKDMDCALREFEEETGIPKIKVSFIENILPFEEIFVGTNHKSYKNKYFLGYIKDNDIDLSHFQSSEVSKVEWKTLDNCLEAIRPYNLEKKQLITNINNVLQEYRLY